MHLRTIALALLLTTTTASAQILTTEVWLGSLDMRDGRFAVSNLKNISDHRGYDNQPAFFPDGKTLVYTSEVTSTNETGLGLHAFLVDLASGARTPLPEARGFSPTPTSDGKGLMMLRQGQVFLHDLSGKLVRPLTQTSTAGYYTRFDDRTYALFMNEPERKIGIYDAKKNTFDTKATGANTAPYRVPGERAVTFVAQDPFPAVEGTETKLVLRRMDMNTRQVTTLAAVPLKTGGQHVWTSRGTLLMASGNTIYEWSPKKPEEWNAVYRADHPELQGISRIAISPAGDRIAIVSTPRDGAIIEESRRASNDAFAARDAAAIVRFYAPDAVVITSTGAHWVGREVIEKNVSDQFAARPDVVYVRTPDTVSLSSSDPAAFERGHWNGRWTTPSGPVEVVGDYTAVWRRSVSSSGTPVWTIHAEVFAPLHCKGSGCAAR